VAAPPNFLAAFVADFADGLKAADAKQPQAVNQRSEKIFQPGIGPHTEAQTVRLVLEEMRAREPAQYSSVHLGVPYPNERRQKCDLAIRLDSEDWFIEVKMWRILGDNGKPNDNILMHILSPYSQHRSALTDCDKLLRSGFKGRTAILIYGYEAPGWPLSLAIDAFEALARTRTHLSERCAASFDGLLHPIHRSGVVYGWELLGITRHPDVGELSSLG
jgi:hypothetical protein